MNLLQKLTSADVVCNDCGLRYGKYSVGCSSRWEGECDVCGERKGVTEVRDYGYLAKGIKELTDADKAPEPEETELASYEEGDITCKFTEEEIGFLNECLDTIQEYHPGLEGDAHPTDVALFEGIEKKITDLYADYCVKYELSPALKAYYEKYGAYGTESEMEMARWEGFRDAYDAVNKLS